MLREVALSFEVQTGQDGSLPKEFLIFKSGINDTKKGKYLFDEKAAQSVMAAFGDHGVDAFMDYNHAELNPPSDGAKAAAWLNYEIRDGELWATNVRWTPPAEKALANKEFRYFSPFFSVDEESRIVEMHNLALENYPATKRQKPLVAATARDAILPKENAMKTVLVALGLKDTDDEGKALVMVQKLRDHERELVALSGKTTHAEAIGEISAWKESHAKVVALVAEREKEMADAREQKFQALMAQGTKDGKIPPAENDPLRLVALSFHDLKDGNERLEAYIKALPKLIAATPAAPAEKTDAVALSAKDIAVAKQMGTDLELLAKNKARRLQMQTLHANEGE